MARGYWPALLSALILWSHSLSFNKSNHFTFPFSNSCDAIIHPFYIALTFLIGLARQKIPIQALCVRQNKVKLKKIVNSFFFSDEEATIVPPMPPPLPVYRYSHYTHRSLLIDLTESLIDDYKRPFFLSRSPFILSFFL